jgi:hypothetical protein
MPRKAAPMTELRAKRLLAQLSPRAIEVLEESPYDAIGTYWGRSPLAPKLARLGLLERHPQAPTHYRISADGEAVLRFAKRAAKAARR